MTVQLVAFPFNGGYTYGEIVDNHIMRGSTRSLCVQDMKKIPLTCDWRAYLSATILEVETSSGWYRFKPVVMHASIMLETSRGHKIPLIALCDEHARHYPAMSLSPHMPRPSARAPPVVVHSAPPIRMQRTTSVRTTKEEYESEDEGRKELDALHSYVISQRKARSVRFK